MDRLALAYQSLQTLYPYLTAAVWGKSALVDATTTTTTALPVCFLSRDMTRFYFDWSEPHECAGTDWLVIFYLCLVVHTISWWGRWLFWEPAANWLARRSKHPTWNQATCAKLSTHMTEASFFVVSAVLAWQTIVSKRWCHDMSLWPDSKKPDFSVEPDLKLYYLLYSARFLSDTVSLFFEERPRDALIVSFIHHFVALSLLHLVAYWGYTRGGSLVMVSFDWADPPLLVAKSLRHLSIRKNDIFDVWCTRLFAIFIVIFVFTRNGVYNYLVYRALRPGDFAVAVEYQIIQGFLLALASLQTYWLVLIVKTLVRMATTGNVEDVREDGKPVQNGVRVETTKRD